MASRQVVSNRVGLKPARAIKPHADKAAALLKALANEQRLMVLCNLLEGPLSVGELNERVSLSQSALSQHLAKLRADGLIEFRRASQTLHYRVVDTPALRVLQLLKEIYCGDMK